MTVSTTRPLLRSIPNPIPRGRLTQPLVSSSPSTSIQIESDTSYASSACFLIHTQNLQLQFQLSLLKKHRDLEI